MAYSLSLLDKSPILDGETAVDALQRTIALAQAAERLGYRRFWLAEHHGFPGLASSAPEILVAHLIARTRRIRIGSGGVLLQHYSPYKVAETFNLLAALAPDRIDLGIGKAPGGLPLSTRALRVQHAPEPRSFEALLAELDGFLSDSLAANDMLAGAQALPRPPEPAERFLLGASPDSARLAAERNWRFVFAGQLNGDPKAIEASLDAYAKAGARQAPLFGLAALAAATAEEARALTEPLRVVRLTLDNGQSVNLGSEEQAAEFARQAGAASFTTEIRRPSILAGTAEDLRRELDALSARFGIAEFVIDTPAAATAQRLASITLLASDAPALAA
ncbi:MAG: MsnO8 family LLM class oxidoreductase [Bosea sp.]|uniref:MsnO8 family LLM class oxidoreductase n=1 Tax=Bosea sp. (in: a-proteobacteria) TaxID=1871050 RepID=UPI002382C4F7|nr:MsnO8 family LLM class oxidoreductase [Bosea sp. (in: a-proteobacteria)]MCP4739290.1 MsnO8 family LLM class oxidoreductase [Bosea sp. (in: a-proteobacteria)]